MSGFLLGLLYGNLISIIPIVQVFVMLASINPRPTAPGSKKKYGETKCPNIAPTKTKNPTISLTCLSMSHFWVPMTNLFPCPSYATMPPLIISTFFAPSFFSNLHAVCARDPVLQIRVISLFILESSFVCFGSFESGMLWEPLIY